MVNGKCMYNVEITTLRRVFFYIAGLDNQSFLVETIVLLYVYCFGFHIRFIGWIYMEMKYCDDGAYTSHTVRDYYYYYYFLYY